MKKGFTLIELLAVIIILAIVALIATPIVLDVVNDAKDSAAKSEASMIVSGVNNYCAASAMKEQLNGATDICKDGVTEEEVKTMVDLGNAKVNSITFDGKVTSLEVESNGRTVKYNGSTYTIDGEEVDTPTEPQVTAYYALGLPTTESSTDYQSLLDSSNAFVKLEGEQLSVCIYRNNTLECFKNNNYAEESVHLQNVFGADSCSSYSSSVGCRDDDINCDVFSDGLVSCRDDASGLRCSVYADGDVNCD